MSEIVNEVERLVTPLLDSERIELVDLTYQKGPGGWTLCFYLDKSDGITLEDCARWSERLGTILDETDLIPHRYSLEVSSPGIYRPIKKKEDFNRFQGERVRIRLFSPMDGQKNFQGILLGIQADMVGLRMEDNSEKFFPLSQVAKANLEPAIEV